MPLSPDLADLARAYDVVTDYVDWKGHQVYVSRATVEAVLSAMGVDVGDPASALRRRREDAWRRALPPCVVATRGTARWVPVHVTHGDAVHVVAELEDGTVRELTQVDNWVEPREVDGHLVGEATFEVPGDLPPGYHRLRAGSGRRSSSTPLIMTPAFLGLPESLRDRKGWGFAAQLYSVRSRQSWGVGDLADLAHLAAWSGKELGADFVLVNPLHAAEPSAPMEPSPYLPTSRRFFNPLYLRVEEVPEYTALSAPARAEVDRLTAEVHAALDGGDVVDRDTAWTAKRAALEILHAVPRSDEREAAFRQHCEAEGEALDDFASWRVLAHEHGPDFRTWPADLRDAASGSVAAVRAWREQAFDVEKWLQWLLDEQLAAAQASARQAGMALGTLHDLAVGVHPGGADAWRMRSTYAEGVTVGAPPDPFNQLGQDWRQPPWQPQRLEESGYAPFRDLVRSVLRHAGGVRVDHVIGLFRLWWVPEGQRPSEGTYVRYDHEALIGVLALEAERAGAVVVGEDLGVVEPSAREFLRRRGILGTSILWFERDDEGHPLPAERWRELCLASVTTHDLPPSAGFLAGDHVRLREELGLLTRPVAEERAADDVERESWLAEVRSRGLLPEGADVEQTVRALHAYLALTPSRLRCVALTDAVGDRRTQNQPGTVDEHPNWRVPLSGPDGAPLLLEDVVTSSRAADLAATVRDPGGR